MTNKNFSKGFTLIEIMVVLIIIAIMASFIVPSVINRPDEARITKVKNDIMVLEGALDLFRLDNGRYPSNIEGLNIGERLFGYFPAADSLTLSPIKILIFT